MSPYVATTPRLPWHRRLLARVRRRPAPIAERELTVRELVDQLPPFPELVRDAALAQELYGDDELERFAAELRHRPLNR